MGSKDKRERLQRILEGKEQPIRHENLAGVAVRSIQAQSTDKQVDFLNGAVGEGRLSQNKLRQTLEANAPKEMRKGIEKLVKKGKVPTVDLLLEEYRHEKSFQKMAAGVGLTKEWFIKLAESEIARDGIYPPTL